MKQIFVVILFAISIASHAQNIGVGVPMPLNKLHVGGGLRLDTLTGVGGAGLLRHDANGVVYGIKFSGNTSDVLRGDGTFGTYTVNGNIGWLLNGNSGTNPSTHFLGTIDNVPLNLRVNNVKSGSIEITTGNTGWGYQALSSNTEGARNTAIGNGALLKNTLGNDNTAIGYNALYQNIGSGNVVEPIPFRGVQNTAMGSNALYSNVNGSGNSAFGTNAMSLALTSRSSAFGAFALEKSSSFNSDAFGHSSLRNNTTGNYNAGFGAFTLYTNTSGYENTAIGVSSLYWNNSYYNSALGAFSLENNQSGHDNTAIGYSALNKNSIASYNTSLGAFSLLNNTIGTENTAVGYKALVNNTITFGNSAFGSQALANNTGSASAENSAFGSYALWSNSSGVANTGIGYAAGYGLPNNVANVTVIGFNTGWNTTSSNQVNIGNFSVSWIGGQTGWFHYSDKRIKNDIKDDVPGLAFITKLKPITYHVDIDKQEEIANAGKVETTSELIKHVKKDWEGKYDVEKIKMTGFFAQDVEEAAKSINYSFNGVFNPKNGGLLSLDYSAFVVPLVKAVQEQQAIIEKQQTQIDALIRRIEALEKK